MLVYNSASFELFYHIGLRQTPRDENSEKCRAFLCANIPHLLDTCGVCEKP